MTALAADKKVIQSDGVQVSIPMIASDIIYQGAMVFTNASGYASPIPTAGFYFAGVNVGGKVDNSSGSAGDLNVTVAKQGVFNFVASGLAQSDVGDAMYATDDQLVTTSSGTPLVGILHEHVDATTARVVINAGMEQVAAASVTNVGEMFVISGFYSGACGHVAVTAIEDMELPQAFRVIGGYAKCQTAPGGAYVCTISLTDGATASDMTITGAATKGEIEGLTNDYTADTDFDVTIIDDSASGATADIQFNFICVRL